MAESRPLFSDFADRLARLFKGFTDEKFAAVLRFLQESAAAQRAATEELTGLPS